MAFDSKDMDDFWNIDMLIPKKKKQLSSFSASPVTVSHTVEGKDAPIREDRTRLTATVGMRSTADESYVPEGYGLIRRVTVKRYTDRYDFYDNFRKAALLYFDHKGEKCDFVPFYSYMPQYSQLSIEQKNYYFYFRSSIRRGAYIKSDYSYLYLYVYEILNLPERIPAEEGIRLLIDVWREYRHALPMIDTTLSLWVQDYCLVHKLPCPTEALTPFLYDAISLSSFPEFYFSDGGLDSRAVVDSMVARLSDYDWRKGKFSGGDNRELFETHMRGAMRSVLLSLWKSGEVSSADNLKSLRRDAFARSLCTHSVKCMLEIEYTALDTAESLRAVVTLAVRYTENRLRAIIGVKSRLGVTGLPEQILREIDDYFARQSMRGGPLAPKITLPEYERLYSAPEEKLSLSGADEIERASWSTTMRLVEYGDEQPIAEEPPHIPEKEESKQTVADEPTVSPKIADALRVAYAYTYEGGTGFSDDAVAEAVNECFVDLIGDVALEFDGEYYKIIEDYKEDIEKWIR